MHDGGLPEQVHVYVHAWSAPADHGKVSQVPTTTCCSFAALIDSRRYHATAISSS